MKKGKYMRLIFLIMFSLCFLCAWTITSQTSNRIVIENSVSPTPNPTPTPTPTPTPNPTQWIMGYYVGYQRNLLPVDRIDFTRITHLVVGRVIPNQDGSINTNLDINSSEGPVLASLLSKAAHDNGRKAILMVGDAGTHWYWTQAANDTNRARFISNLLSTMDNLGYDGLDLDWEPIYQTDKPMLSYLIQELRRQRPSMILMLPVGWVRENSQADSWIASMAPYLDKIGIMSYSMTGAWQGWLTWHSSALEAHGARYPSSIKSSVNKYLATGIPKGKLVFGVGFYGMCWKGTTEPRQETEGTSIVGSDNVMSYRNIIEKYFVQSAYKWDSMAKVSYLTYPNGHGELGCNFISYDDEQSLRLKGEYAKSEGLGGILVWTINQEYIPSLSRNPPLEALTR